MQGLKKSLKLFSLKLFKLEPGIRAKKATIEEHIDGSMSIKYNGAWTVY